MIQRPASKACRASQKRGPECQPYTAPAGPTTRLECREAVSRDGKLVELRNLPGGRNANAFAINDFDELVAFADNGVRDPECATNTPFQIYRFEAVKWDANGEIQELSPLKEKGDNVAFAMEMNELGQVVGSSETCQTQGLPPFYVTGRHAVLWERDGTKASEIQGMEAYPARLRRLPVAAAPSTTAEKSSASRSMAKDRTPSYGFRGR